MAKIGDHVDTIHGIGTVLSDKRVFIHGTKDKIISFKGDKDKEKKRRIIKGVVRTRLQIESDSISNYKKFLRYAKKDEEKIKVVKEVKPKKTKPKESSSKKRTPKPYIEPVFYED